MKLIKPPYSVKLNDATLKDVVRVDYEDGTLVLETLITDYPFANTLLNGAKIDNVYVMGCGVNEEGFSTGAVYRIRSYTSGIITQPREPMKLVLTFKTNAVHIGWIAVE